MPFTFDPDVVEVVAHDLGDVRVGEELVENPVAEDVRDHLGHERPPLRDGDLEVLLLAACGRRAR
jgi:hypothetical protein